MKHFNKVSEITDMIDFLNKENEERRKKAGEKEINSISTFLARNLHKSIFFMKDKQGIIIDMSKLKSYAFVATIADEGTSIVTSDVPVTGYLKGVAVTAGAMDASDTYTITIADKNGVTVFSRASLAESTTSVIWADKYNELGTTIVDGHLLNTPMAGPVDVTITASAAQNDAAVEYTVFIYYE